MSQSVGEQRYAASHVGPQGPGDARPTALQIIKDENLLGKWPEKTVFITGASNGIGVETARALHATGATVYIGVRDIKKGQDVADEILSSDPSNTAPIHVIELALDSLASVRKAAEQFHQQSKNLNILICNAGVMATPYGHTEDGFETQFGTNHLGHFLLFQLLKPALLAASTPAFNSRVVMVSSIGHRYGQVRHHDYNFEGEQGANEYDPQSSYGQSKTANIWMSNYIDRHYGPRGLHSTSLHPGGIWSGLQKYVPPEQMAMWHKVPEVKTYMKSAAQGAATTVYAAVSEEWEGKGGKYLSNCVVQGPAGKDANAGIGDDGYSAWAYNEEGEERLWKDSCKMVGVSDDE
jgi:NAD(P)-dependent dehydrogenase (short-subunit alcohol dehydrogenase family)